MAIYGITQYASDVYGYFIPPAYRVDPFIAAPSTYSQITVSWNKPSGTIEGFRLIKNMYGTPVDQDDGEILLDITSGYPGSNYVDNDIVPGAYHYYGFYVLVNSEIDEWVRSGLTGCLMINNYSSSVMMQDLIPNFYVDAINAENELVEDPTGNTFLSKFMGVFGWGFDYLRTQYDTYLNTNNPWDVPLNSLYNMAAQFNININPDIHPYTLRKAIYYNATINQLRGTPSGIATELAALTGWDADITIGPNILLNNDQSYFADPFYEEWSAYISYNVGENVTYGDYFYQCTSTANYGNAPSGTSSSNSWWEPLLGVSDSIDLLNTVTDNINTWETIYLELTNGTYIPSVTQVQLLGGVNASETVEFNNPTTDKNTVIIMLMSTGGITVDSVSFAETNMTLVGSANDSTSGGSDYWYVYYIPDCNSGQEFTIDTSGSSGEIYAYIYEVENLGSTVVTNWSGGGGVSANFEGGVSATISDNSFCVFGIMDDDIPNITGGSDWVTGDAGTYGIGGNFIGGNPTVIGNFPTGVKIFTGGVAAFTGGSFYPVPLNYESIGVPDPLNTSNFAFNSIGATNVCGSTTNLALRSLSRTTSDVQTTTTNFAPDKYQVVADGIPIPYIGFNQVWNNVTEYSPGDIVLYNNQPFLALRASQGLVPPYSSPGSSTIDWAPLSFDQRFRICISAYETASSAVAVYPFIEWYDANGNFIMRLIARNPTAGSAEIPNQLAYDSFTVGEGSTLSTRTTNDGGNSWTQEAGSFTVSPYGTGCAYPTASNQRSIATINTGNANAQVGLTFVSAPSSGMTTGLILRYADENDYFRADMTSLYINEAGVLSNLGTYSTPCTEGDRLLVNLNGSTITCYRNNQQILQVTSTFNESSTIFGVISEEI